MHHALDRVSDRRNLERFKLAPGQGIGGTKQLVGMASV